MRLRVKGRKGGCKGRGRGRSKDEIEVAKGVVEAGRGRKGGYKGRGRGRYRKKGRV